MKKLFIFVVFTVLSPNLAHAIIRDVEIPKMGDKEEYVSELVEDHPLPEGIRYEITGDVLYLIGDAEISATWDGYDQAEGDSDAEENAFIAGGMVAVAALGYGLYKKSNA
jgi:hypothetical protein